MGCVWSIYSRSLENSMMVVNISFDTLTFQLSPFTCFCGFPFGMWFPPLHIAHAYCYSLDDLYCPYMGIREALVCSHMVGPWVVT